MTVLRWAEYDPSTGQILRIAIGTVIEMGDAPVVELATGDDSDAYIHPVTLAPTAIPAAPTGYHVWNWTTHTWVVGVTLAEAKLIRIKQARQMAMSKHHANITVGGHEVPFDTDSERAEVQALLIAAMTQPGEFPQDFMLADGSIFAATVANTLAVRNAINARRQSLTAAFVAHRNAILTLTTLIAVRDYDITQGWPT